MILLKYLSSLLRFFSENDYTHKGNLAVIISDIYENNPEITLDAFTREIIAIKSDFFRINKINRQIFAETLFTLLEKTKQQQKGKIDNSSIAQKFITHYFEIGYKKDKNIEYREKIFKQFRNIPNPHPRLLSALDLLLQRIDPSHQVGLHGVKEYSGVDLVKKVDTARIGFQMKTINDDISEDKIRVQTSKALEYNLEGFVWIYGRPPSKSVDNSIQAAFHHFARINEKKQMYCTFVIPEVFAELLLKYNLELST